MIGTTLPHYRITAALGAGGMGEVFRATDTHLGREVAIKVLPAEVASDPERLARLRREAHLLAALNHPNIAAIHGLEEVDGQPFLVLEVTGSPVLVLGGLEGLPQVALSRTGSLVYTASGAKMRIVELSRQGRKRPLNDYSYGNNVTIANYDVSADGQHFVMIEDE